MTPLRKLTIGLAALGSIAAGAVGISAIGTANAAPVSVSAAATSDTAAPTPVSSDTAVPTPADNGSAQAPHARHAPGDAPSGPHSANGITEAVLTGDTATSVEAAVKAAYPDATINRMETDAEGAAYEAHITKADGSDATVKLDASFAVTETVTGHG